MSQIAYIRNGKLYSRGGGTRQLSDPKMPGDYSGWDIFGSDPNQVMSSNYDMLARMSTSIWHSYPAFKAAVTRFSNFVIGSGMPFVSQPNSEILNMTRENAQAWGLRFQNLLHLLFKDNGFYQNQILAYNTVKIQGDAYFRIVHTNKGKLLFIPQRGTNIDFKINKERKKRKGVVSDKVVLGISLDQYGQENGIFLKGQTPVLKKTSPDGVERYTRLQDDYLAEQVRGYPLAYNMISPSKKHDSQQEATISRTLMEAIMMITNEENPGAMGKQMGALNSADRGYSTSTSEGIFSSIKSRFKKAMGVTLLSGNKGESIKGVSSVTPSNTYEAFNKQLLKFFAMSVGIGPTILSGDTAGSSYATEKAAQDIASKCFDTENSKVGRSYFPILKESLRHFVNQGLIEAPGAFENDFVLQAYLSGRWISPKFKAINPVQDAKSKDLLIKAGLVLRSDASEGGEADFKDFLIRRKDEEEAFLESEPVIEENNSSEEK